MLRIWKYVTAKFRTVLWHLSTLFKILNLFNFMAHLSFWFKDAPFLSALWTLWFTFYTVLVYFLNYFDALLFSFSFMVHLSIDYRNRLITKEQLDHGYKKCPRNKSQLRILYTFTPLNSLYFWHMPLWPKFLIALSLIFNCFVMKKQIIYRLN